MKPHNKYTFEEVKQRLNLINVIKSDGIEITEINGKARCNSFVNARDKKTSCYVHYNDEVGKWFFFDNSINDGGSVFDYWIYMHYDNINNKRTRHLTMVDLSKLLEKQEQEEEKGALSDV